MTLFSLVADPKAFVESIQKAAKALIDAEPEITRQDTVAGDGDAGLTLKSGALGVYLIPVRLREPVGGSVVLSLAKVS